MVVYQIRGNYGILKGDWMDPNAIVHSTYVIITVVF